MSSATMSGHEALVEARSNRLARGLRRLGISEASCVAVFVCDVAGVDAAVAVQACRKLGASSVVAEVPRSAATGRRAATEVVADPPDLVLACECGVRSLHAVNPRTVVVGNGHGVRWWQLLEARESPAALETSPSSR